MNLLAFDTTTEVLTVAVSRPAGGLAGGSAQTWQHTGAGAAQASASLIEHILHVLHQAGLQLGQLDAICFGCGPGSFTGLRTACAVAQGLAFGAGQGAGVPVLPIDSLLALAEEARFQALADRSTCRVMPLLDARMDEVYAATWDWHGDHWTEVHESALLRPEALAPGNAVPAGNVFAVYAGRLGTDHGGLGAAPTITALPTATAMLRLAPALLAAGQAVDAALALPRYVRDKVAKTTAERDLEKAHVRAAVGLAAAPVRGS